jgi:hypothetical protein
MRSKRDFSNLPDGQSRVHMQRRCGYWNYILEVAQVASRSRVSRYGSARGGVDAA